MSHRCSPRRRAGARCAGIGLRAALAIGLAALVPGTTRADDGPVHVQLAPFGAPLQSPSGQRGVGNVTVFATLADEATVETFCAKMPFIRDAFNLTFASPPLLATRGEYDPSSRRNALRVRLGEVLPGGGLVDVILRPGAVPPPPEDNRRKVKGATRECRAIVELPWLRADRLAAEARARAAAGEPAPSEASAPSPKLEPRDTRATDLFLIAVAVGGLVLVGLGIIGMMRDGRERPPEEEPDAD